MDSHAQYASSSVGEDEGGTYLEAVPEHSIESDNTLRHSL
jgi:hypothetical protein